MLRLQYGLSVALVIATVLVTDARAESVFGDPAKHVLQHWRVAVFGPQPQPARLAAAAPASTVQAAPTMAPLSARVVKPLGATVRVAPSTEARVLAVTRCGDTWPVESVRDGWVAVKTPNGKGWIAGGRVIVSNAAASADCAAARTLAHGSTVIVEQEDACLPLRERPSSEAEELACAENGHAFTVLDGPQEAGPGEDWFRVSSPTTGTEWALGAGLRAS